MATISKQLYEMLKSEAEADRKKALLSLDLIKNFPAGIGDHSTKDFWDNATEALKLLASADERIETLEKYFDGTKELI
tara:strand:+ start:1524 stop:1757 length:234 start_codon:yes stop_codon:yes gene_type:complete